MVPCPSWYVRPHPLHFTQNISRREEADEGLDEICRDSGIRLITIDRPGCGHIPSVPLSDRLDVSCSTSPSLSSCQRSKLKGQNIFCQFWHTSRSNYDT